MNLSEALNFFFVFFKTKLFVTIQYKLKYYIIIEIDNAIVNFSYCM